MRCFSVLRLRPATASIRRVALLRPITSTLTGTALRASVASSSSSSSSRAFSAAAAADAKKGDAKDKDGKEKPKHTPEEVAAFRLKRKAEKEAKRKAREELIASTGVKPSFLDPTNLTVGYLGPRAYTDTERTIDQRRFEKQMSSVRAAFKAEYTEKAAAADEKRLRARQDLMLAKAERFRRRLSERLAYQEHRREELRQIAITRAKLEARDAKHLADREHRFLQRRQYQAGVLRAERANGRWVLDASIPGAQPNEHFEARINAQTFFDGHVVPQGYWPDYASDRLSSWEVPLAVDEIESFQSAMRFGDHQPGHIPRSQLIKREPRKRADGTVEAVEDPFEERANEWDDDKPRRGGKRTDHDES